MRTPYGHRFIEEPPSTGATPRDVVVLDEVGPAQNLLRARHRTTQAGFTSERIPQWLFRHRPILFDDGDSHDEHRRALARFFAPRILEAQHGDFIRTTARDAVAHARTAGSCRVDELALLYSVAVTSRIVGLNATSVKGLAKRLTKFFRQPPVNHRLPDHGRSTRQWITAACKALGPVIAMYFRDVRPAIRARQRQRESDIISFLLDRGYSRNEILMECITYGTAGMVTTREFMCVALWHFMRHDALRARYLVADQRERLEILSEIIRLEPPVGHLYRRVGGAAATAEREPEGCPYGVGTLIDIDVRAANIDQAVFGDDAEQLCPDRNLRASERVGLSFGDGEHRCPGQPLALMETDVLMLELLRAHPVVTEEPRVEWDTLIEGYQIRGFVVTFSQ